MAPHTSWNVEFFLDYAVAHVVNWLSGPPLVHEEPRLLQVFRNRPLVDSSPLLLCAASMGTVGSSFCLLHPPVMSLPSVVFFTSSALAALSWERTVTTDPGEVPLPVDWQEQLKPKRVHFCKVLKRNVVRMDHYCFFVANCIGLKNHKYFYLFVLYSAIAASVDVFASMHAMPLQGSHVFSLMLRGPGVAFSSTLATTLWSFWGFHTYLLCKNKTTLEFVKGFTETYDIGLMPNLTEVLGKRRLCWLLPFTGTDSNGLEWGFIEEEETDDKPEEEEMALEPEQEDGDEEEQDVDEGKQEEDEEQEEEVDDEAE